MKADNNYISGEVGAYVLWENMKLTGGDCGECGTGCE